MYKYLFVFILLCHTLFSQTKKNILLKNGIAHIGNGMVIENSYVSITDGKINLVTDARATRLDMHAFDTIINVEGKHIYPGLIAPNCVLGLQEAESIRATNDFAEIGEYNPHIRALTAYNTESKVLETAKTNGVLYTQSTPRYGVISGTSSVFATSGWNWEDAVIRIDDGIHLNFPEFISKQAHHSDDINNHYNSKINELHTFFENALAYSKRDIVDNENLRLEAMKGLFNGSKTLYIHADYVKDIIAAINFSNTFKIKKMVIVGGKDSYKITKMLKENHIAVMLNRLHDLPSLPESDVDLMYKIPYLLQKDSVLFCLQNQGDLEAMNARNISFLAGTAAAYGLTKEQALQSITLNSAKILGVDHLIGSIENGKLASIIVSDGDILDMKTNHVILAFMNGRLMNLENFQNTLYKKYSKKFDIK